jgi:two-component system, response regulator PdtaR
VGNYALPRSAANHSGRNGEVSGMNTVTSKPYSILITDDDSGSREALREIVEPEGYRTLMASSGEEAVDIVREENVHLVLLDVHMPRLTGLETVQLVHQINELLPCILVTANVTDDVMRQAFSVRAYSVIPKPVSKNVLLYTVVRALMKAYGTLFQKEQDQP